jgi:hypothetical protein
VWYSSIYITCSKWTPSASLRNFKRCSLISGLVVVLHQYWPPWSPNFTSLDFYLWGRLACLMVSNDVKASLISGLVVVLHQYWPPWSPHFTSLVFYLWGRLACLMYRRSTKRRGTLRNSVLSAALTVCSTLLSLTRWVCVAVVVIVNNCCMSNTVTL